MHHRSELRMCRTRILGHGCDEWNRRVERYISDSVSLRMERFYDLWFLCFWGGMPCKLRREHPHTCYSWTWQKLFHICCIEQGSLGHLPSKRAKYFIKLIMCPIRPTMAGVSFLRKVIVSNENWISKSVQRKEVTQIKHSKNRRKNTMFD